MKRFLKFSLAIFLTLSSLSCVAQETKKAESNTTTVGKVEVYYFHYSRRCNTCVSVEENAKLALETLYADKVKSGEYTFTVLNLDDASSKPLAEKLSVGGQSLLVVCGTKKVDITDKGFMNAHNLEKMEVAVKTAVEQATKL